MKQNLWRPPYFQISEFPIYCWSHKTPWHAEVIYTGTTFIPECRGLLHNYLHFSIMEHTQGRYSLNFIVIYHATDNLEDFSHTRQTSRTWRKFRHNVYTKPFEIWNTCSLLRCNTCISLGINTCHVSAWRVNLFTLNEAQYFSTLFPFSEYFAWDHMEIYSNKWSWVGIWNCIKPVHVSCRGLKNYCTGTEKCIH